MSLDQGYWKNKFITDLKKWGVEIPESATYDQIKSLHKNSRAANKAPKEPRAPKPAKAPATHGSQALEADTIQELKEMVAILMAERNTKPAQNFGDTAAMKELLLAVKEGNTDARGMLRAGYIPPDDIIPTVKFFAPFHHYYIPSKPNGAVHEPVPLNIPMLSFKPQFEAIVRTGDMKGRKFVSTLEVNSRTVYKWLTGKDLDGTPAGAPHSDFNRSFYLDINGAIESSDVSLWAQSYQRHQHELGSLTFGDLTALVKQQYPNIPVGAHTAPDALRSAVAKEMTDEEFSSMNQRLMENLQARNAGQLIVGQNA